MTAQTLGCPSPSGSPPVIAIAGGIHTVRIQDKVSAKAARFKILRCIKFISPFLIVLCATLNA